MVIRVNYKKNSYINNYLKKLFCQAYCFNLQFNQDRFFVKHTIFEKGKDNDEENFRMPIAWHPKIWWNFCMAGDEKKEIEPIFTQ